MMNDLSQAFGSSLFFRILLPGLTLSVGLHPFAKHFASYPGIATLYSANPTTLFAAEVTILGLLAYAATIPIYHIAQGQILRVLTWPAHVILELRFNKKYNQFVTGYGDKSFEQLSISEANIVQRSFTYLADFPILVDELGAPQFSIRHSTRVGNISATYESYPDSRYGINAEAFWNHCLFLFPADVRRELESNEALASGTLVCAFEGWLVAVIAAVILILIRVGSLHPDLILARAPASPIVLTWLLAYGTAMGLLFNYLSRVSHRAFGRLYRAAFDVHAHLVENWLKTHRAPFPDLTKQRAEALRTYLLSACESGITIEVAHPSVKPTGTASN